MDKFVSKGTQKALHCVITQLPKVNNDKYCKMINWSSMISAFCVRNWCTTPIWQRISSAYVSTIIRMPGFTEKEKGGFAIGYNLGIFLCKTIIPLTVLKNSKQWVSKNLGAIGLLGLEGYEIHARLAYDSDKGWFFNGIPLQEIKNFFLSRNISE